MCAQVSKIIAPNKGKGRKRRNVCSTCNRAANARTLEVTATTSEGPLVFSEDADHDILKCDTTCRKPFDVKQMSGDVLYLPHFVRHRVRQTKGEMFVCSDGITRNVVISFAMWVNESLGAAGLRFSRTQEVEWKEKQVIFCDGGGINSKNGLPSKAALVKLQEVVDKHLTTTWLVATPSNVVRVASSVSLGKLGLDHSHLAQIVKSVSKKEIMDGGTLDAGLKDAGVDILARNIARRLVGTSYMEQNSNATIGVRGVRGVTIRGGWGRSLFSMWSCV